MGEAEPALSDRRESNGPLGLYECAPIESAREQHGLRANTARDPPPSPRPLRWKAAAKAQQQLGRTLNPNFPPQ